LRVSDAVPVPTDADATSNDTLKLTPSTGGLVPVAVVEVVPLGVTDAVAEPLEVTDAVGVSLDVMDAVCELLGVMEAVGVPLGVMEPVGVRLDVGRGVDVLEGGGQSLHSA
jgi:hypothetical protein